MSTRTVKDDMVDEVVSAAADLQASTDATVPVHAENVAPPIHVALARVMADVEPVSKSRENVQQRFKFRGIDDVLAAARRALVKHDVIVLPQVQERISETRQSSNGGLLNVTHLRMRYVFVGPAGDSLFAETWGEAHDSADKATNKAMSAAYKYALIQALNIPTEGILDDSDRTTVEGAGPAVPVGEDPISGEAETSKVMMSLKNAVVKAGQQLNLSSTAELADDYAKHHEGLVLAKASYDELRTYLTELQERRRKDSAA